MTSLYLVSQSISLISTEDLGYLTTHVAIEVEAKVDPIKPHIYYLAQPCYCFTPNI